MESRVERIKVLKRLEERRRRLPKLLSDLSQILNKHIDEDNILSLYEIDNQLIELNSTDFDFNYLTLSFPKDKAKQIKDRLNSILRSNNDSFFVSLSSSANIVVAKLSLIDVIEHFDELIELDGDAIWLCDENYKCGFTIDLYQEYWFYEEQLQFLWIYELKVYGNDWIKTIINSN